MSNLLKYTTWHNSKVFKPFTAKFTSRYGLIEVSYTDHPSANEEPVRLLTITCSDRTAEVDDSGEVTMFLHGHERHLVLRMMHWMSGQGKTKRLCMETFLFEKKLVELSSGQATFEGEEKE